MTLLHPNSHSLQSMDPTLAGLVEKEKTRQELGLEMIASENYCSQAVMQAQGSVLTNKYAEGYPGKRWYDGCEFVDQIENLAIERITKLFGCKYANVQPHSGSGANMAVYLAELKPEDTILGMNLDHGGHLTHGAPVNFSGKLFNACFYGVDPKTERLDFDAIAETAKKEKPKLIIAGASAYPRAIDFARFKEIADDVGATLLVDMAHIAGLVAGGVHPTPIGVADYVTSTTHKTLRGPRGGIILTNDEKKAKKANARIFPGIQGGPLEHVIAAKAVAFHEALQPEFKSYQKQVIANAQTLADELVKLGVPVVTGGTDNHLVLMKVKSLGLTGSEASAQLDRVGITCNKNMIPGDEESPMVTSGVRLGTPALTTRGMKGTEMKLIAGFIVKKLRSPESEHVEEEVRKSVQALCGDFPIYPQ